MSIGEGLCRSGADVPYNLYKTLESGGLCRAACQEHPGCIAYMYFTDQHNAALARRCYLYFSYAVAQYGDWEVYDASIQIFDVTSVNPHTGVTCYLKSTRPVFSGSECSACPPGTFQDRHGQAQCELCAMGTYEPHKGQTVCSACPHAMRTSAPGARSVVQCTCPPGTGLGGGGYEDGCTACAAGSYAPDVGPAFAFVGEGTCTGSCAHTQILDSEGTCALECVRRAGCVGFSYASAASVCQLHWAQPRATEVEWAAVGPATACAGINGSTGGEGQACWRKDTTHPQTQLANLLHAPIFELVGDGYCRSANDRAVWYIYNDNVESSRCRSLCEQDAECTGYMHAIGGTYPNRCYRHYKDQQPRTGDGTLDSADPDFDISQSMGTDIGQCFRRHAQPAYENLGAGYCRGAAGSLPYALSYAPSTEARCQRTCDLEDGCIGYMFAESGQYEKTCYLYYAFARGAFGGRAELNRPSFELSGASGDDVGYCHSRNSRPALACIACAPGSYQTAEGRHACTECGSAGYAPARGHRRCVQCLPTRQSAYSGAMSKQACLCAPGSESADNGTCTMCDSGEYSALGAHSYEFVGFGHCSSAVDTSNNAFKVNGRFAGNITETECRAECARQSSCVGYTFSTHRPAHGAAWHERCWVHGQGLAHGLLHWQTAPVVPGAWRAYAFAHLQVGGVLSVADEGNATRCHRRLPLTQERTCRVCPAGSSAQEGAVAISECTCDAGYARANATGPCILCPSGTYSPGNATGACITCPDPTRQTSPAGSTSALECSCVNTETETLHDGQCLCLPGHGRASNSSNCTLCTNGTYSPGNATTACITCPENTTSLMASTMHTHCYCANENEILDLESHACVCMLGFGRASAGAPCTACPPGTYDANSSTDDCIACAAGFTSPARSTNADNCTCAGAHEQLDSLSQECVCLPGYGRTNSTSACAPCAGSTFSGGSDGEMCSECPQGTTSPPLSTSASNCSCVGANEQLDASGAGCICLPGYGRTNSTSACAPCANGTFSGANASDACLACPLGATSPPRSTDAANCSCQPGYGRASATAGCSECPAGAYGPSGGEQTCQACPETLSSPPGSADIEACGCSHSAHTGGTGGCVCPPGSSFDSAHRCIKCSVGSYSPGAETSQCAPCPANMTTLVDDARSVVDCVCLPGHGMTAGGYTGGCAPCAAGNFQAGEHVNFEYLGMGNCTSTCANWREMADEGECALVCAGRVDCIGYSHGTPLDSNVSRCILYFRDERSICNGWESVSTDGQCAALNASWDAESMSCRLKNFAAPAFGFTSLDDVQLYEDLGTGKCRGIGGQLVYQFVAYVNDLPECEAECTKMHECIGFNVNAAKICYLYMLFLLPDTKLYDSFDASVINRCGDIHDADASAFYGQCMRKKRRGPLSCIACDTGTAQVHKVQGACDSCSSTSFSFMRGSQTCEACPVHTENSDILAQSVSACRCAAGFYANEQELCTTCPDGLYSLRHSSTYTEHVYSDHGICYKFALQKAVNREIRYNRGVAVQVADNVSMAVCEHECERYSACIGYQYVVELSSTNIPTSHCTLFPNVSNVVLAGTLPVYENVVGGYQGWAIVLSSQSTRYFTPIHSTVAQEHCYTRELGNRTCHACPLGGRAPPGSGSEAACLLTRALPAGLNASAWRALGAPLLDTSTGADTLDVLRYNKHAVSLKNHKGVTLRFYPPEAPYTCVNITVRIGPLEAQAPGHDIVFGTPSAGILASFSAAEPYARVTATMCGISDTGSIIVSCQHTALDAEFSLEFYVGDAGAPPSATVTPVDTPDRELRPHVHAHGHNVSLWGVGGARGVTVVHDYAHDLVYTFARNLTHASVGAVHRNSSAASVASRLGLWLWAHDCIEYVHNEGRETVQAHRLPLPTNASVHMLAPDPTDTWVVCVLSRGTAVLVLDIHSMQGRTLQNLHPARYVHAVYAHTASYLYVAYARSTPPGVTDDTRGDWVRYRLDMRQYMVQVQLNVTAQSPPLLCGRGSSRDAGLGICVACERSTYKHWHGDEPCLPCGSGETTAHLGSDAPGECKCKRGFGFTDADTRCEQCPPGEYKHTIGDIPCANCVTADVQASHGDGILCACPSGLYFDAAHAAPACEPCRLHTFKNNNGTGLCTACGAHMYTQTTQSKHEHACRCDAGHGLNAASGPDDTSHACGPCAPGSYAPGGTRAPCTECAQGRYAEQSAQSSCTLCPEGFFAQDSGARECELCVLPNSTSADHSTCALGLETATDPCANTTTAALVEYLRVRREDLALKTLAELEHSPGGLPDAHA